MTRTPYLPPEPTPRVSILALLGEAALIAVAFYALAFSLVILAALCAGPAGV